MIALIYTKFLNVHIIKLLTILTILFTTLTKKMLKAEIY